MVIAKWGILGRSMVTLKLIEVQPGAIDYSESLVIIAVYGNYELKYLTIPWNTIDIRNLKDISNIKEK